MASKEQVEVENINCPGQISRVDAAKYLAMKETLMQVLPSSSPGLTQKEMMAAVKEAAPQVYWPGGEKSGWWAKTVQLDLEAKGVIKRTDTKPLTWYLQKRKS